MAARLALDPRYDELEARQIEIITSTTDNFGSSTVVTVYATVVTVTSTNSFSTTVYLTTVPTATSYATPTPPLTSIFTPPSSCLSGFYNLVGIGWILGPPNSTGCFPPGYATSIFYSPGICPSGYAIASGTFNFQTSSDSQLTENVGTCCPSGFTVYDGASVYPCYSEFNPSVVSSGHTFSATTTSTLALTVPNIEIDTTTIGSATITVTNSVYTVITGTEGALLAQSIQIRWKSGDFSLLNTSAGLTPNPTPGPTTTSSLPASEPASGLSQGAKIAIGVVVPLVVLGILLGALLWWIAKRRASHYQTAFPPPVHGTDDMAVPGPEPLHGDDPELEAKTYRPELDSSQYYQVSGDNGATEFPRHWGTPNHPPRAEVESNNPRHAVRSFSSDAMLVSPAIPFPTSTSSHDISRKPLADSFSPPAAALNPPTTLRDSPIPAILRPSVPLNHNHSPPPSSDPSVASLPLDSPSQDASNNLVALQRRYEKVRDERERLSKLQELTELEERLHSQIQAHMGESGEAGAQGR